MLRATEPHRRGVVVTVLGIAQILAFGSTFYLPAVLAKPIAADTGWSLTWIVGGLSIAMLISGLVSTLIGRWIQRFGGRPVMATSSALLALGLTVMAFAPNLPTYLIAWAIMGLGMAGGLYDAAFSTLGRMYGEKARGAITWVTLFGGFASTVCWPLSAFLVEQYGWRATCLVYAAIYLLFSLPAHLIVLPRTPPVARPSTDNIDPGRPATIAYNARFVILAAILTFAAMISSMVAVHLLTLLQAGGMDLAAAVAFGTIVGPAQVGGRLLELLLGRNRHPIWAMIVSVLLMAAGLGFLASGFPLTALALALYGAGNGIHTIARGALPLVLFDPQQYALVMGRLAAPALLTQALAPFLGAYLLEWGGSELMLAVLVATAGLNVLLTALLWTKRG